MNKSFFWTEDEDRILLQCVEECSTYEEAFVTASHLTGRTVSACKFRFSQYLRKTPAGQRVTKARRTPSWTEADKRRLADIVINNQHNLQEAFRIFSGESHKSVGAIQEYYYKHLRFWMREQKNVKFFATIGKRTHLYGKNYVPGFKVPPTPSKRGLWSMIKSLLFNRK